MQPTLFSFLKKTPTNAAKQGNANTSKAPAQPERKRKALVISSDEDDDVVPPSPQPAAKGRDSKKPKAKSPSPSTPSKRPKLDKLKVKTTQKPIKAVDPMSLFGGETKRIEAKKAPKPKEKALQEFEDDAIDQSLMEVDLEDSVIEAEAKKPTSNGNRLTDKKEERKQKLTPHKEERKEKLTPNKEERRDKLTPKKEERKEKLSPKKEDSKHKLTPKKEEGKHKKEERRDKVTPKKEESKHKLTSKKEEHGHHKNADTSPKPSKHKAMDQKKIAKKEDSHESSFIDDDDDEEQQKKNKKKKGSLDSSMLTDEERHERKRAAAMLYQKYKNRSSCLNHGSKEVPEGKPNCLAGLTFLVTGVLESLEREEAGEIVKKYGGKLMTTVGKRLKYLIVGEDAGPKKLAQAEEFGITILSEDDFFNLIRQKSGMETVNGSENKEQQTKASPSPKKAKQIKEEPAASPPKKAKLDEFNNNLSHKKIAKQEVKEEFVKSEKVLSIKEDKSLDIKQEFPRPPPVTDDMKAWVDRYKPTSVKDIIGQQGPASNVAKLTNWLSKWYINHDGKKKLQKPNPWAKNDDGSFYKAALLSGPPGIGKTTTATLVCKELGFDAVEFNASDTRSKRLLKEEVSELLSNKSLYGYFHGNAQAVSKKHVLIMDEVDGMAGNEDRGGIQELIALIKDSSVPIICMCNDRNHQKMRSLVNYCYDLRFNRPQLKQIKGRIMSICAKENVKLDSSKIDEIIAATNNDIRQTINHISLLSAGKELNLGTNKENNKEADKTAQKDLKMGPWDVVRKVFSADEHKTMSFYDKCDLFFHDYSMAPLFVQQNYLIVNPAGPRKEVIGKVAMTADSLSLGDLVDKKIRASSAWALLPTQAIFSSVMPGEYMSGNFTGQINFPGWLGKYSRANKRCRLAQEIHDHTRVKTSGSRLSVRLDYAPFLLKKIVKPLVDKGLDGVEESLSTIKEYHLLREDIESLIELSTWPGKKSPMDAVDGKVKAALTRAYNKEVLAYTYSASAGVKKKKAEAMDDMEFMDADGEENGGNNNAASEDEKDDDLENDGLIKAKKKTATAASKASTKKPATSGKAKAATKAKK